ncbi:MAG: ribose-5-phosphate isomerase A [Planctomycetota bacterium]
MREKVVAAATRREIIAVARQKVVSRLGAFPLPVEVVPFARGAVSRALRELGAEVKLRQASDGSAYRTDNGNDILDCVFAGGIADPPTLERALALIPGLLESGLVIGLAHVLVIGNDAGECEIREKG